MIEKYHTQNCNESCANHDKNTKLENLIQNQIFLIKKVKRTEKKPEKNLNEDRSLKDLNGKSLNNVELSFENIDTNLPAQDNKVSPLNKNQIDIIKNFSEIKNNFDKFINTMESNNILIQNTVRKIEMIFNGLCYCYNISTN